MSYRIEFSYIGSDGLREYEVETYAAYTLMDAIAKTETFHDDLENLIIERVWKDTGNEWEDITPNWL